MSREQITDVKQWDSVYDWSAWISTHKRVVGAGASSEKAKDKSWDNGMDFDEALTAGLAGGYWAEGSKLLRATMEITDQFAARQPLPRVQRAIEGAAPCVGAYLQGHPRAMFKRDKQLTQGKPVLTIGVCMGAIANSTAKQKLNRGAAILTAISELESQGYRCQLVAVHRLAEGWRNRMPTWISYEVTVKKADERFNPSNVAFMLAHAAAHRRLMFAAMERSAGAAKEMTQWGYGAAGASEKLNDSMQQDFDVYFPGMTPNEMRACNNVESAFKHVRETVTNQLKTMAELTGQT